MEQLTQTDIEKRIFEMFKNFGHDEVTPESNLNSDLAMDSLDVVEFGMSIEKEFKISMADEDIDRMTKMKVCDVVTLVDSLVNRK